MGIGRGIGELLEMLLCEGKIQKAYNMLSTLTDISRMEKFMYV
jgi:hypothetical protein